ncbi:MAG: chemotaxis-specific protein-glutamate methyltransferase CheB [bacterium]
MTSSTAPSMRVAIVNDLAVACEALRRVVASDPALSVAWIARDGAEAMERAERDRPDVILMDLIMPRVDGVEATRGIMRTSPCPILVVTATVTGNAGLVYEALGAGALDAVNTPTIGASGSVAGGAELLRRIHLVARVSASRARAAAIGTAATTDVAVSPTRVSSTTTSRQSAVFVPTPSVTPSQATPPLIVAIGASTGGPRAVADLLRSLPKDLRAAYLVVQHVSVEFVEGYAQWLAAETGRTVSLARAGMTPREGEVLVAGEDRHLAITRAGTVEYREEPKDHLHRPSVDELFASLAGYARPGVAVLLTGMGRDGADGMLALRRAGWHTIAQDEATSVVWGMPGAAHRAGASVETLPIGTMGDAIVCAAYRAGAGKV